MNKLATEIMEQHFECINCDDKDIVINELKKFTQRWIDIALQNQMNTDFYRGLIDRIGESIGDEAYLCDDGTESDSVLALKVVEIIERDYLKEEEK